MMTTEFVAAQDRSILEATVPLLQLRGVGFGYPSRTAGRRPTPVLTDVGLDVHDGEFLALIGRNGCGKSSLLGLMSGLLRPWTGAVRLRVPLEHPVGGHGEGLTDLGALSPRRRARRMAVMHQSLPPLPGVTVRALVEQGRHPHRGMLGMLSAARSPEIEQALEAVDMLALADRDVDELSGGERQRARLALALAQQPSLLLLDEPTAHLDVHQQLQTLDLVDRLRRERGLTVVAVLHELDHALRFATRVVALHGGGVVADGPVEQVVDDDLLRTVYSVQGRVLRDAHTDRLHCLVDRPVSNRSDEIPARTPPGPD